MKPTGRSLWERMKAFVKKWVMFFLNPRLLLCFGIAWFITNGWSYAMFGLGTYYGITWMAAVGGTYMAFLWFPFTPEKILTVLIAIFLLRILFPKDKRTLEVLRQELREAKETFQSRKKKKKAAQEARTDSQASMGDSDQMPHDKNPD